jgi:hypothetical protein
MAFAPSNETLNTTPSPARSTANHRCKPMRANEQAKGASAARLFKQHTTLERQDVATNGPETMRQSLKR